MKFSELHLHPLLQANLDKIQFVECTDIQAQAIPWLRKAKDVAGLAQTGTGKTAAFLIPLLDRLLKSLQPHETVADSETVAFPEWKKKQFILILVPTRELAEQVYENAKKFVEGTGFSCVSIYGGTTYDKQIAGLKSGAEFVIATPGRFIDLYKEHVADLGLVRAIVFDEADRMFDMGFKDDMKFILRRVPRDRQFTVFSATLNFDVLNVAYEFGADPIEVNISRDQAKAENVKDHILHVGQDEKPRYLLSLLKKFEPRQTIIFSNFKHNVDRIARFLNANSIPAVGISSLLTQAQRNRVMGQFKAENDRNILVATDLAARGLDILGVDMVVNFELPDDAENYVHRIGRTGRAGQTGQAFSLVSDRDVEALQRIEEYLSNKLEVLWLENSELVEDHQPFPNDHDRPRGPAHKQRRESSGPRASGGGGHRDRRPNRQDRPDRSDRPDRPRRRPQEGGDAQAREAHRDRQSGRHRHPQNQGQPQGQGQNPNRREGRHGQGPRPQGQRPQGGRPHRSGQGQRRHHGGPGQAPRPSTPVQAAVSAQAKNKSLGQKVGGFFKKLFGGD